MTAATLNTIRAIINVLHKFTPFLLPLTMLVALFGGGAELVSVGNRQAAVSTNYMLYFDSFEHSQGVTTDGESYFFSHKYGLVKTELNGKTVITRNFDALPAELVENFGVKHIGGISYCNGKIYCSVEDSKKWQHPLLLTYDSETLQYTGECVELDPAKHDHGFPWVAADSENNILYTSIRDHAPALIRIDLNTKEYLPDLPLTDSEGKPFTIYKIQGGEMYKGKLYVATNDETQAVYEIDVKTGVSRKYFDRNLTKGSEGEGITVLETADGAVFHAIDMGPLFVNSFFRHYAPINEVG